ncbi:MAG TPA: hypothetical protein DSN98_06545 [Thermoplasmata archaeon]|jgi:hypothetical membrane protein|nr:MAG TPA: hypothetical protein DSN98_06545 [Thermoplasmata archaeon]
MMVYSNGKVAGIFFFIAASQFVLGLIVAEALFPGYSISTNYISDLGVGPSSMVFNMSIFLTGLLSIIGVYFFQRTFNHKVMTIVLIITAVATMGVGIFTENSEPMHMITSFFAFLFSGLSAIVSCRIMKYPFNIIVTFLGLINLSALILFIGNIYLGLGVGGMERMIMYPTLIWMIGFGSYLIALPEKS